MLLVLVPSSGSTLTGKSFEQASGPVIPSIVVDGDLYDDVSNTLVDPNFDGQIYDAASLYNDNTLAGHSHIFLQFGENQAVSPKPLVATTYRFEIKVRDGSGTLQTLTTVRFKLQ